MQFPLPHQSSPAPGPQKQLHPSCTGVDSADWEEGVGVGSAQCGLGGWGCRWLTLGGSLWLGNRGSHQRANRRKHAVSTPLGQWWPSDSQPLQGGTGFYFFGVLTSFLKNNSIYCCNINFNSYYFRHAYIHKHKIQKCIIFVKFLSILYFHFHLKANIMVLHININKMY